MKHHTLPAFFAAMAMSGFVLTILSSDLGAAEIVVLRALCAVAVLGTACVTAFLQARGLV